MILYQIFVFLLHPEKILMCMCYLYTQLSQRPYPYANQRFMQILQHHLCNISHSDGHNLLRLWAMNSGTQCAKG